jgi:hypothetical protein
MVDAIDAVRTELEARYRDLLKEPTWTFEGSRSDAPAHWDWQTEDLRNAPSRSSAVSALLLDAEVGICLYFVDFSRQPKVRETIARALAVQNGLLPVPRSAKVPVDEDGSWRVAVNWLVEADQFGDWVEQIADLREKTGHFEEVAADAIVRDGADWGTACSAHGFPRLLFSVRELLAKTDPRQIDLWRSANEPVLNALNGLASAFVDPLARQCAEQAISVASAGVEAEPKTVRSAAPTELFSIEIENFRNLRNLGVAFRSHDNPVSSTVIQGPNGSGKSSIFEALSFAVAGGSMRYLNYLEDINRSLLTRDDRYLADYLAMRGEGEAGKPAIRLNGDPKKKIQSESIERLRDLVAGSAGNFFSQECSRSLVAMPGQELGAQIAGAFSEVAAKALDYVDAALEAARTHQRAFNADWSLRGNVVRRQTVLERVVARALQQHVSVFEGLRAWLRFPNPSGIEIAARMQAMADRLDGWITRIPEISTDVSKTSDQEIQTKFLTDFFEDGREVAERLSDLCRLITEATQSWPSDLEREVERLGSWISARERSPGPSSLKLDHALELRADLNKKHEEALRQGVMLRDRKASLEATRVLLPSWSPEHDDECPVCGSDVSSRGGISSVVSHLLRTIDELLEMRREEVRHLRTELSSVADLIAKAGGEEPPVPYSEQPDLIARLALLLPDEGRFEDRLGDDVYRADLLRLMPRLRSAPHFGAQPSSSHAAARVIVDEMETVVAEFEHVAALPVAWKAVRDAMQAELAAVASSHLPRTIQAVWHEIAQAMLPAPWQYPGNVCLKVGKARSANQVTVVVQQDGAADALAAHVMNGAEVHNLGLAWFLTRYLTDGRFNLAALVMDDPAHSMDQPTFRDFCRMIEVLLRLHRKHNLEVSLVLLLHQDNRAVDAARATNGVLHQLRWNKKTPVRLRQFKLRDDSSASPQPILLQKTG